MINYIVVVISPFAGCFFDNFSARLLPASLDGVVDGGARDMLVRRH